jgi:hypothetical protein
MNRIHNTIIRSYGDQGKSAETAHEPEMPTKKEYEKGNKKREKGGDVGQHHFVSRGSVDLIGYFEHFAVFYGVYWPQILANKKALFVVLLSCCLPL